MKLRKEEIPSFILDAFPEYDGENFEVDISENFSIPEGNNDGSKREYRLVSLVTGKMSRTNFFDMSYWNNILIPRNIVVVKHETSCGKDLGLFITVGSKNVNYLAIESKDMIMERMIIEIATQCRAGKGMKEYFKSGKEDKISKSIWM